MLANTEAHRAKMRPHFPESFDLFYAVIVGTLVDVWERLLAGDNPNAVSTSGRTPLFYAVQRSGRENLRKADALITRGAVIDIWDHDGLHPLHNSARDKACINWLLDHHVNPNVAIRPARERQHYPVGWTALHMCVDRAALPFVELLLARGADPNSHGEDGSTPLHVATRQRIVYKRLIRTLIDVGADVNAVTREGRTPLHEIAARMGGYSKAATRLLIFRGAIVDTQDAAGLRPVDLLRESEMGNSLRLILEKA